MLSLPAIWRAIPFYRVIPGKNVLGQNRKEEITASVSIMKEILGLKLHRHCLFLLK